MSDQIDRIVHALSACCSECADRADHIAYGILEHAPAGLLASPEHDAKVAARTLRDVVAIFDGDCIDLWDEFKWTSDAPLGWGEASVASAIDGLSLVAPWLSSRADRIEREAGESDTSCNCGYGGFHDDINPRCRKNGGGSDE